jgi:hypothetical protein
MLPMLLTWGKIIIYHSRNGIDDNVVVNVKYHSSIVRNSIPQFEMKRYVWEWWTNNRQAIDTWWKFLSKLKAARSSLQSFQFMHTFLPSVVLKLRSCVVQVYSHLSSKQKRVDNIDENELEWKLHCRCIRRRQRLIDSLNSRLYDPEGITTTTKTFTERMKEIK